MLITGLPEYYDGCYKVEDVVQLLLPFGFQNENDNIYIVPQIRMVKQTHQMHNLEENERLKNATVLLLGLCVCFGSQAFVKMPTMEAVHNLITKAREEEKMTFKCAKISFHVLGFDNPASPVSTWVFFIMPESDYL